MLSQTLKALLKKIWFLQFKIGVKDIHSICKGLEDNGCKITTQPKTMKNSTTVLAFVEDPDGYKIELIE